MITNLNSPERRHFLVASELVDLSTDTKPINVGNGSTLREIDTGKKYMFDAQGKTWYEQTSSGGGGEGGGSGLFVVNIANDPETDEYSADKTFDEAIAAANSGKIIVMHDSGTGDYAFATYPEASHPLIMWNYGLYIIGDPASLEVGHFEWGKIPSGSEKIMYGYSTFTADSDDG